jgi:dienelactone hydrolase
MKVLTLLLPFLFFSCSSIKKEQIQYATAKTKMKGHLVYNDKSNAKVPGILVVHEWWGQNEYAKKRAEMLAELGYVALAVDMYGEGTTAKHPKEAKKFATATFKNMKETKMRFRKALETLKNHPRVDKNRIAAVGYCYGGGIVLKMAADGEDLDGIVSFHGSVAHIKKIKKNLKTKLLVLNGEDDPLVKEADLLALEKLAQRRKANLKIVNYPDATHAFTNPGATEVGKKFKLPVAYNKEADMESWNEMKSFLENLFN